MHEGASYLPLLLICGLSLAIPLITDRIKIVNVPVVVGEILAGILIGKSGLNLIHGEPWLDFLSRFGFVYLMFLSGLEIDFSAVEHDRALPAAELRRGRSFWSGPLVVAAGSFALTMLVAGSGAFGLAALGLVERPLLIALILSTTSVGIVVPVLKQLNLTRRSLGQGIILAALVADFSTMLLITILGASWSQGGLGLDTAIIGVLFLVFLLVYQVGRHLRQGWRPEAREESGGGNESAQLRVRFSFALMILFVALAEKLGAEVILGAFLAGAIVSLLHYREAPNLELKLNAIGYGFLIPIFFIMVGVNLDVWALFREPRALMLLPALLVVAFVVKLVAALVFVPRYGLREAMAAGALLSSRLSLIIAAAAIAFKAGRIDMATKTAIVTVAVVTSTLSPLIFFRLHGGGGQDGSTSQADPAPTRDLASSTMR